MSGCAVYVVHKSSHIFILCYEGVFKDAQFLRSEQNSNTVYFMVSYKVSPKLIGAPYSHIV